MTRRSITAHEAAAHMRHYLGLPTDQMRDLRDTLIEARGNPDLLAAITQELTRRDAAPGGGGLTDEQLALTEDVHDASVDAWGSCCIDDDTAPVCETIALGLWTRGYRRPERAS